MAEVMTDEQQEWVPADTFGARLALVRQAKGWNVQEAAEACGLNDDSWRGWEYGRSPRGMETIAQKIADVAGCSYVWLMAGGPLPRSRCFALLALPPGQMELALTDEPDLVAVS